MNFANLLSNLISIGKVSKTDFALFLNMSPSGLSKLLSGLRLPGGMEKAELCRQCAGYLSEHLYAPNCYQRLTGIFPVIYDFSSVGELDFFLNMALTYSVERSIEKLDGGNRDHQDAGVSYLGKLSVMNQFCIVTSDYLLDKPQQAHELHTSKFLFNASFSEILGRIKFNTPPGSAPVIMNQYFSAKDLHTNANHYGIETFFKIRRMFETTELHFLEIQDPVPNAFLLIEGKCLLFFTLHLDGTPMMTLLRQRTYVMVYMESLNRTNPHRMSFSKSELMDLFRNNPKLIDSYISQELKSIYNFMSLGFMMSPVEMTELSGEPLLSHRMSVLKEAISCGSLPMYIGVNAITRFIDNGKLTLPMIGSKIIPAEERLQFLKRFDIKDMDRSQLNNFHLIDTPMPSMVFFNFQTFSLLYLLDEQKDRETIFVFTSSLFNEILQNALDSPKMKKIDLSPELWRSYVDRLMQKQPSFY